VFPLPGVGLCEKSPQKNAEVLSDPNAESEQMLMGTPAEVWREDSPPLEPPGDLKMGINR
jgi:hypothetical protein